MSLPCAYHKAIQALPDIRNSSTYAGALRKTKRKIEENRVKTQKMMLQTQGVLNENSQGCN